MTLVYTKQLSLQNQKTNKKDQKIDNLLPKSFEIVIITFQIVDTLGR